MKLPLVKLPLKTSLSSSLTEDELEIGPSVDRRHALQITYFQHTTTSVDQTVREADLVAYDAPGAKEKS